jgi:hypothetical protein
VVRNLVAAEQPARVRAIGLAALRELEPGSRATRSAHLAASRDPTSARALALLGLAGLAAPTDEVWQRFAEVAASHADPAAARSPRARSSAARREEQRVE